MVYRCLFEQSGTFKNEFKNLGYEAFDYDILNEFGQTDYVVDLFKNIEEAYDDKPSIFDEFSADDYIMAFFPCVRFEAQILLWFRGDCYSQKNHTDIQKLEKDIQLHNELHNIYIYICKLVIVCLRRNLKLVIENPYSEQHYLQRYWCMKPKLIDNDRTLRGDYFQKPTQYWFINCEPTHNFIFEPINNNKIGSVSGRNEIKKEQWSTTGAKSRKVARSMIHKEYANRFIREFVLTEEQFNNLH